MSESQGSFPGISVVTNPSDSDEHYTPRWVFDAMGVEFDLDVAAPQEGSFVPAKRRFTIHDDGLTKPWSGLVWCNPPFSQADSWTRRWSHHADGVLLAPFAKSAWLHDVAARCDTLVIPNRLIDFLRPDGRKGSISYACFIAGRGKGAEIVRRVDGVALSVWGVDLAMDKGET